MKAGGTLDRNADPWNVTSAAAPSRGCKAEEEGKAGKGGKDEGQKEKNKVPWSSVLFFLLAVLCAWLFSFVRPGARNDARGFDGDTERSGFVEADAEEGSRLFSEEEASGLDLAVKEMAGALGMNIMVYAGRAVRSDEQTKTFADGTYDELFGPDTDGVFYYLDLSGKTPAYDYLSTSGRAILSYEKKREAIFTLLDGYLPSSADVRQNGFEPYRENIKSGINAFLAELMRYDLDQPLNRGRKEALGMSCFKSNVTKKYVYYLRGTLYVTRARPPLHKFLLLFGAELAGLLAWWRMGSSIRRKYRFIGETDSRIYIADADIRFTERSDTFLRGHTASRYNPPSESGGGGRSGGGGGGGTHGGGGHHR